MQIYRKDVTPFVKYEGVREELNAAVVELERKRRIVTPTFSFLFEHRDIVLNQINEMVYLEKINDEGEIDHLIDLYSEQLPQKYTLSVTMFIEFPDEKTMMQSMKKFSGVENSVYLTFDGNELKAIPEEGRSTDALESTLQYLKFSFSPEQAEKFRNSRNVYIETRHPNCSETGKMSEDLLEELKIELIEN